MFNALSPSVNELFFFQDVFYSRSTCFSRKVANFTSILVLLYCGSLSHLDTLMLPIALILFVHISYLQLSCLSL